MKFLLLLTAFLGLSIQASANEMTDMNEPQYTDTLQVGEDSLRACQEGRVRYFYVDCRHPGDEYSNWQALRFVCKGGVYRPTQKCH